MNDTDDLDDIKRIYSVLNGIASALDPLEPTVPFDRAFREFSTRFGTDGPGEGNVGRRSSPRLYEKRRDGESVNDRDDQQWPSRTGGDAVPASTSIRFDAAGTPEDRELSPEERRRRLSEIAEAITHCDKCPLSLGRTNAVPGEGVLDPMVMIIGEGPGAQEDAQGKPFVGNAGQYLDKWLSAIGLSRDTNVYIANIVKCRPPNNRDPQPEESDTCFPYLAEQIDLIRPRMIVTVGRISMRILTGTTQGITRIHGQLFRYNGVPLVPTFHPSGVLRNPAWRRPVWEDLKTVRNWLIDNAGHAAPPIG